MDQYHLARPVQSFPPVRKKTFSIRDIVASPVPIGWRLRAAWGLVAVTCAGILVLAMMLKPDARGHGTHEALGLYPCGFSARTGLPCPTCGMTTSFSHVMHGNIARAFIVQPAGAMMCFATGGLLVFSWVTAWRGRMANLRWDRVDPVRLSLAIGFFFVGSWGFKIALGMLNGNLPSR